MDRVQLRERLERAGVPDALYAFPGIHDPQPYVDSYYVLAAPPGRWGTWDVGVHERGQNRLGRRFDSEDEACRWLHDELIFDQPAPQTLTSEQEDQALKRAETIAQEVLAHLRQAATAGGRVGAIPFRLDEGVVVDRFGQESGSLLNPDRTPYQQRSLPPSMLQTLDPRVPNNYYRYEVVRGFRVRAGLVASAFEQPGGGVQFKLDSAFLDAGPELLTVRWLRRSGYLRSVAVPG